MQVQKKHLIAGLIGVVSISGAYLYLQYQKLMNYEISFKSIKINSISLKKFDFNLFLNFKNKSNLKFALVKQKYDVYVNGVYLTTLKNDSTNEVLPNSDSVIGLNVQFDPKEAIQRLKLTATSLLTQNDKIMVKIVTKMQVKYGFLSPTISYTYEDSLKNMMA